MTMRLPQASTSTRIWSMSHDVEASTSKHKHKDMSHDIEATTSKHKHKDVVIDVDPWENSMKMKMEEYTKTPTEEEKIPIPTIYKVPETLRWGVNHPYEPHVISIGPYHRGKPKLEAMEKSKWQCLRQVLSRNREKQLEDYIEEIKKLEVLARSCYSEKKVVNLINSKDFVEMMVLDGCFIVQFLRKEYKRLPFNLAWLVRFDMLLIENQIPFFILQCIFVLSITYARPEKPIMKRAEKFCSEVLEVSTRGKLKKKISDLASVRHILHMYHTFHTFTPQRDSEKTSNLLSKVFARFRKRPNSPPTKGKIFFDMIRSALELDYAGIKFREKREWHSLLEVTFKDGVLEIPPLFISDASEPEFRNLIAFEQLYPFAGTKFCEYARFMDDIISTSNDVALLHKKHIIQYRMGSSKDVVNLFDTMNKWVIVGYGPFELIYLKVNEYFKQRQCRVCFCRYFVNNPWAAIPLLVAIILLFFAAAQIYLVVRTLKSKKSGI